MLSLVPLSVDSTDRAGGHVILGTSLLLGDIIPSHSISFVNNPPLFAVYTHTHIYIYIHTYTQKYLLPILLRCAHPLTSSSIRNSVCSIWSSNDQRPSKIDSFLRAATRLTSMDISDSIYGTSLNERGLFVLIKYDDDAHTRSSCSIYEGY